ncbi:type 4a pilus biogenesis protein PilO [Candidatus Daviesbacteria bacterium]|nr:type 4a pilus biogenesis protein PilO [Candidatus Daviesbacteria bacterium]
MNNKSNIYSRYFTYVRPITRLPVVKNYGPAIFTLITASVLIFFAIKPTIETILVLQKKLADQEQTLQKLTDKVNNLSLGKKNYDDLDPSIKQAIVAFIPDAVSLKSLTQNLEESAQRHEASISALQIEPIVIDIKKNLNPGSLAETSFIFNTEGDYKNLIALLQELKRSSRLISIDSLSMSKASEDNSIIMSLKGKAYYLK